MKISYLQSEVLAVAQQLLRAIKPRNNNATIVGFSGDLGAGKTTLVQAIASQLGVVERVVSPTFVVAKWYKTKSKDFQTLVHIDAYRIESITELEPLGFKELVKQKKSLVLIEWPENIKESIENLDIELFKIKSEKDGRTIEDTTTYENTE